MSISHVAPCRSGHLVRPAGTACSFSSTLRPSPVTGSAIHQSVLNAYIRAIFQKTEICLSQSDLSHYPTQPTHKQQRTTMALPLQSFMLDLLATIPATDCNCKIALVVDNARLVISSPKERALRKRFRPDMIRREPESKQRLCHIRKPKDSLDVSDHSKKESRWESTMASKTEPKKSTPVTPVRTDSSGYSPPQMSGGKHLSPVMEESRINRRRVNKGKVLKASFRKRNPLDVPRLSPIPRLQKQLSRSRNTPQETMQQVEEAIACCKGF